MKMVIKMKFNIGDKIIYPYCGTMYPCEILIYYPKTTRYRIEYYPAWNNKKKTTTLLSENELFISELDYLDSQINDKKQRISLLQIEISVLQAKRYEVLIKKE